MSSESGIPDPDPARNLLRRAREDAFAYIGISAKTSGALTAALLRAGYTRDVVDGTVSALESEGWLKDRNVARSLLARSTGRSAESRESLRNRMIRRGIAPPVADESVRSAAPDLETAIELLHVMFPPGKGPHSGDDEFGRLSARMVRRLASRGYDSDTAAEAVERVLGSRHDEG